MRIMKIAVAMTMLLSANAQAQIPVGTPVFRVPLANSGPAPVPVAAYNWENSSGSCSTTCGTGTRSTTNICRETTGGTIEPDAQCTANVGPKPADTVSACTNYSGCSFDWVKPAEVVTAVAGRVGCGDIRRQFAPHCDRSDGTVMAAGDHGMCNPDRPDYDDVANGVPGALGYDNTAKELGSCNTSDHSWKLGGYGAWSSTCSASATRTRTVQCQRNFDGAIVADGQCAGPKPSATETGNYAGCTYTATYGAWSACSGGNQTRSITCTRSDSTVVGSSNCGHPGDPTSQSQACTVKTGNICTGGTQIGRSQSGTRLTSSTTGVGSADEMDCAGAGGSCFMREDITQMVDYGGWYEAETETYTYCFSGSTNLGYVSDAYTRMARHQDNGWAKSCGAYPPAACY